MNQINQNNFSRTQKMLADRGLTELADAAQFQRSLVMQVQVQGDISGDEAAQAALLTSINCGSRALGEVRVAYSHNSDLSLPWAEGTSLDDAVVRFGGSLTDGIDPAIPVYVIGQADGARSVHNGVRVLGAWMGWSGGVLTDPALQPIIGSNPLAGIVSGALAVSEIFQHFIDNSPVYARRSVGVSLWRPDIAWMDERAEGPELRYLPKSLWLLGLGHLGQASAWSLGCLPYPSQNGPEVGLVDYDRVVEANHSTGLLTNLGDVGMRKTRLVAERLEQLGFGTTIVERKFGYSFEREINDPAVAFAGFDRPEPRRALAGKFAFAVDAGLGSGPVDCLAMSLYSFPSEYDPQTVFEAAPRDERTLLPQFQREVERRVNAGEDHGDAQCGVMELAGTSAAVPFVGAVSGAHTVASLLRHLHEGQQYSFLGSDLRDPSRVRSRLDNSLNADFNPGFILVQPR